MISSFFLSVAMAIIAFLFSDKESREFIRVPSDSEPGSGSFFDEIAPRYDLLNHVISLGLDTSWRRQAISQSLPSKSLLDVATGTADIALEVAKSHPSTRVVGIDPSPRMLSLARQKISTQPVPLQNLQLIEGTAESLPFDDSSFDAVVCAFGVRNFRDRDQGLREMARVLKPGGKLIVLELSMPSGHGFWDIATRFFVTEVMPRVASWISGNLRAYRYLSASMDAFPRADAFKQILGSAGFAVKRHRRLAPFGQGPDLYTAVKKGV